MFELMAREFVRCQMLLLSVLNRGPVRVSGKVMQFGGALMVLVVRSVVISSRHIEVQPARRGPIVPLSLGGIFLDLPEIGGSAFVFAIFLLPFGRQIFQWLRGFFVWLHDSILSKPIAVFHGEHRSGLSL